MKNKTLWIIFAALLAFFLLSKLFNKKSVRSFTTDIIQIDTKAVDRIVFHNSNPSAQFEISKHDNGWTVKNTNIEADALSSSVSALLDNLNNIKAQRPVAKSQDKWAEYEVDNEKGKRIELFSGSKVVEDLVIGRFNFNQQTRSAKSYVRRSNDDNVYVIDGFLSMSIGQSMDAFRDKNLVTVNSNDIAEINIQSELGNRSAKKENYWVDQSGTVLDSTTMANYVNKLARVSGTSFYDNSDLPATPIKEMQLTLQNGEATTIKCYAASEGFVIHSSQNPESYFSSDSTGVFKTLFLEGALAE